MAMELQLSTKKAQDALKQIEQSIGALEAAFNAFKGDQSGLNGVLGTLTNFKGPNQAATENIKSLSQALSRIGKLSDLGQLSKSLNTLAGINVNAAAESVKRLSEALSTIKAPRGLSTIAQSLERITAVANKAAAPIQNVAAAVNQIQPSTGLRSITQHMMGVGPAAHSASGGVNTFRNSISQTNGILQAFGVYLGAVGFAQFMRGTLEATAGLDRFKRLIANRSGDNAVAAELEYINGAASKLAVPLDLARSTYAKLYDTVVNSGREAGEARKLFEGFAMTFAALGLNAEQSARGFRAVEQIMSKGAVNAEELRQQLGELFPAFTLLAKSMGVNTMELAKMMEAGKVSSSVLFKFADSLADKFGGAAVKAVVQLQGSIINLGNAWQRFQESFGGEFWAAALPGIQALATALNSESFITAAKNIGAVAGIIAGSLMEGIAWLATNVPYSTTAILGLAAAFAALRVASVVAGLLGLGSALTTVTATATGAGVGLSSAFAVMGGAATGFIGVLGRVAVAAAPMALPLTGIALAVTGIATAVGYALPSIDQLAVRFVNWLTGAQNVTTGTDEVARASSDAATEVNKVANASGDVATEQQKVATSSERVAAASENVASSSIKAAEGFREIDASSSKAGESAKKAASEMMTMAGNASSAATIMLEAGNAASSAANMIGSLSSALSSSASAANAAAAAYRNAAAAARELAAARAAAGEGGGSVDSYAGGGIVGKGNGRKMRVETSTFMGAPHFSGGGTTNGMSPSLPGGGIPAVLHDNEAVVPLTGGGAIPVSMGLTTGGTASGPTQVSNDVMAKAFRDELFTLRQINLDIVRTNESIDQQTMLMGEAFEVVNRNLVAIDQTNVLGNGKLSEILAALKELPTKIGSTGTSKGIDTGTGSGSYSSGTVSSGKKGGGGYNPWNRPKNSKPYGIGGATPYGYNTSSGEWGFATGTPNTSEVSRNSSGFPVTVHPDEAIIPLPDGRSVPVTLPDSLFSKFNQLSAQIQNGMRGPQRVRMEVPESNSTGTDTAEILSRLDTLSMDVSNRKAYARDDRDDGAFINRSRLNENDDERLSRRSSKDRDGNKTGSPTIIVQMTVNTPDASSFRASQTQILQDLNSKLARSARTLGNARAVDDPTRPAGKN